MHHWGLGKFIEDKTINEKFFIWVDRKNKIEVERQIARWDTLRPHLGKDAEFEIDNSLLFMVKEA